MATRLRRTTMLPLLGRCFTSAQHAAAQAAQPQTPIIQPAFKCMSLARHPAAELTSCTLTLEPVCRYAWGPGKRQFLAHCSSGGATTINRQTPTTCDYAWQRAATLWPGLVPCAPLGPGLRGGHGNSVSTRRSTSASVVSGGGGGGARRAYKAVVVHGMHCVPVARWCQKPTAGSKVLPAAAIVVR
jgi:hypothetical protein